MLDQVVQRARTELLRAAMAGARSYEDGTPILSETEAQAQFEERLHLPLRYEQAKEALLRELTS